MFSKIFEMILYRILILFLCSSTVLLSHELTDFDQYFYESRIYHENFENENSETNLESLILELDSYDDDQSFYYKIIAYDSLGLYLVKHGKLSEAAKYFTQDELDNKSSITIITGPESGFSDKEIKMFDNKEIKIRYLG